MAATAAPSLTRAQQQQTHVAPIKSIADGSGEVRPIGAGSLQLNRGRGATSKSFCCREAETEQRRKSRAGNESATPEEKPCIRGKAMEDSGGQRRAVEANGQHRTGGCVRAALCPHLPPHTSHRAYRRTPPGDVSWTFRGRFGARRPPLPQDATRPKTPLAPGRHMRRRGASAARAGRTHVTLRLAVTPCRCRGAGTR